MKDEPFYEAAAMEVAQGRWEVGLAAKAFVEAQGDERRQRAAYIELRAKQLQRAALGASIGAVTRKAAAAAQTAAIFALTSGCILAGLFVAVWQEEWRGRSSELLDSFFASKPPPPVSVGEKTAAFEIKPMFGYSPPDAPGLERWRQQLLELRINARTQAQRDTYNAAVDEYARCAPAGDPIPIQL